MFDLFEIEVVDDVKEPAAAIFFRRPFEDIVVGADVIRGDRANGNRGGGRGAAKCEPLTGTSIRFIMSDGLHGQVRVNSPEMRRDEHN